MNKNTHNNSVISREILELIPWFTIDKLSVDDQDCFENALETYPLLRQQIEIEQQMCAIVSVDNSLLNKSAIAPTAERLKTVFNIIDTVEHQNNKEANDKISIIEKFTTSFISLFIDSKIKSQYACIASVGLLVLSVALLTTFVKSSFTEENYFTPASAVTQANDDQTALIQSAITTLLVGFNGTKDELKNNQALKGKQMTIEGTPENEGIFQINFQQDMNANEINEIVNALIAQEEKVWFAGESY